MSTVIRPLRGEDAPAVLALNQEVVHKLAPLDEQGLAWFLAEATCAWAAEVDGELAGFVLVLAPGHRYDSDNYRWFSARYDDFLYLDRVAVAAAHRRNGVASAIYDAVQDHAATVGRPVLLEVNVDPPNEASLAFHRARGFAEVGRLAHDGGAKVVSLQAWHPGRAPTGDADRMSG